MSVPRLNEVLLRPAARVGSDFEAWFVAGGGAGLRAALADPDSVLDTIRHADLHGMGGAGFPTAHKWGLVADVDSEGWNEPAPCYASSTPGESSTAVDHMLMFGDGDGQDHLHIDLYELEWL